MSRQAEQVHSWILSFKCPDKLGVVARYSEIFFDCGAFITEVSNYSDPLTGNFFLRCVFDDREPTFSLDRFMERLLVLAEDIQMEYALRPTEVLPRGIVSCFEIRSLS